MSNFYESLYSTNRSISVPTQDNGDVVGFENLSMDELVQQELDFSGQSGDGTKKSPGTLSSHGECQAKDPAHCPHHGIPAAAKEDGLKKDEPDSSSKPKPKMTRREYEDELKKWLSRASDDQITEFLKKIDDGKHDLALKLFNDECTKRSIRDNESRNGGEWM